jgi:hypothetical protein
MDFLGLIFQCENGLFVKIEKQGVFELPNGKIQAGYAGREITALGNTKEDYIFWDRMGRNNRHPGWNLKESKSNNDPTRLPEGWPRG